MGELHEIPIELLRPGKHQPRSNPKDDLDGLAASIKATGGVIQPVVVLPKDPIDGTYEIVAGERRWRASQQIGLPKIRCLILDDTESLVDDESSVAVFALLENLDRQDLSEIDIAKAVLRLKEEFGLKQREIARRLGRSTSDISRLVGIGRLPQRIQTLIDSDQLNWSQAKYLLSGNLPKDKKVELAETAASQSWTVKQLRYWVQEAEREQKNRVSRSVSDHARLARTLSERLGSQVELKTNGSRAVLRVKTTAPLALSGVLESLAAIIDAAGPYDLANEQPCSIEIDATPSALSWMPED